MVNTSEAVALLLLLNLCHFAADYSHLSTPWMLSAKRTGSPADSILLHACVHGGLMLAVLLFFRPLEMALSLAAMQILSHFAIDVWKGKMNVWFPVVANPANKLHWYLFGFDQFLHQMVIVAMVFL